ncbi:MAG: serine/threonine-protein kinase [Solirubrobacterales bacterium]
MASRGRTFEVLGECVLNRFTLEQRIGSGAFGTVYRAWDERLQRPVAVKVIDRPANGDRVLREAQAAARLAHPGIVTLYELWRDGKHAFLVTELIEGATLRDLSRAGRLSDAAIASIGADCGEALAHAHHHGVVHRDIKPENILVAAKDGRAKLVDFGIARIVDAENLTATGDVLGTLAYMAPEQAEGYRPGPHADVYSLALTLYEALSGEQPVMRDSAAATARAIGEPLPSLGSLRSDLPDALVETLDAALDPLPEQRPDALELAAAAREEASELDDRPLVASPTEAGKRIGLRRVGRGRPPVMPLVLIALCSLVILRAGVAPDPWILTVPVGTGLLALVRPRLALALAAAALAVWLAAAGSQIAAIAALAALAALAIARSGADLYGGRGAPTPF